MATRPKNPNKVFEEQINNFLSRPFSRRLDYLYVGLGQPDSIYFLSNTTDTSFEFCHPNQSLGFLIVKNADVQEAIQGLLNHLQIPRDTYGVVLLKTIRPLLSKVKFDLSRITVEHQLNGTIVAYTHDKSQFEIRMTKADMSSEEYEEFMKQQQLEKDGDAPVEDVVVEDASTADDVEKTISTDAVPIYKPIELHTMCMRAKVEFEYYLQRVTESMESTVTLSIDVKPAHHPNIGTYRISYAQISALGIPPCTDIPILLIKGFDWVDPKCFDKVIGSQTQLLIWRDGGVGALNYGTYYQSEDAEFFMTRNNIYLFPRYEGQDHVTSKSD